MGLKKVETELCGEYGEQAPLLEVWDIEKDFTDNKRRR